MFTGLTCLVSELRLALLFFLIIKLDYLKKLAFFWRTDVREFVESHPLNRVLAAERRAHVHLLHQVEARNPAADSHKRGLRDEKPIRDLNPIAKATEQINADEDERPAVTTLSRVRQRNKRCQHPDDPEQLLVKIGYRGEGA